MLNDPDSKQKLQLTYEKSSNELSSPKFVETYLANPEEVFLVQQKGNFLEKFENKPLKNQSQAANLSLVEEEKETKQNSKTEVSSITA